MPRRNLNGAGLVVLIILAQTMGCNNLTSIKRSSSHRLGVGEAVACEVNEAGMVQCWGVPEVATHVEGLLREQGKSVDGLQLDGDGVCGYHSDGVATCFHLLAGGSPSMRNTESIDFDVHDRYVYSLRKYGLVSYRLIGQANWRRLGRVRGARQISAGSADVCVMSESGVVKFWGRRGSRWEFYDAGFTKAADLSVGAISCAALESAAVACRIGDKLIPIGGVSGAIDVEVGEGYGCARTRGGDVVCWRLPTAYSLLAGPPQLKLSRDFEGVDIPQLKGAVEVRLGHYFSCALIRSGADHDSVKCWHDSKFYSIEEFMSFAAKEG